MCTVNTTLQRGIQRERNYIADCIVALTLYPNDGTLLDEIERAERHIAVLERIKNHFTA